MRKPKLLALILALALVCSLGLVACKPDDTPPDGTPTLYTVTFVTNGGSSVPDQGVYEGKKITKPGDPARGGYDFVAWFKEEALATEWKFDTDTVTANTTLYAKWKLQAASQDANFQYALVGDTYTIAKKTGVTLPVDVILPSEHDGKAVTAIADNAFENEKALKSVVIPDSITEIGKQAFRNCAALETINEAKNVEQIGSNAFYGTAWALALSGEDVYLGKTYYTFAGGMYTDTEITVKDGTIGIAAGAFDSKEKLTAVTLPSSLKYIGDYAFGGAQKGTGLTTVTLPAGLVRIGNNAFRNAKLTSVTIGAAVEYIGDSAFAGCPVAELNYNAANAAFGSIAAFNNNTTAASVKIAGTVTAYPAGLFSNWTGVESVDFGGVTEIPASAFDGKTGLKEIAFGGAASIGNYAFRNTGVTELTLPQSLTDIGNGAFANCANLTKITLNAENLTTAPGASALAFANCPKVTEIVIGENAENVPAELFRGLSAVAKLTLGGAKEIGDRAFYGISITSLTVPAQVTLLGQDAFGGNAKLTSVAFNAVEAVTATGSTSIFGSCPALATVTVGAGVKNIPAYFLTGNTVVSSVTLPDSVTSVGDHAFDGCAALNDISGVDRVTSIGQDAFNDTPWFTEYMKTPGLVYLGSVLYAFNGDMPANYALTVRAGTTAISPEAFKNKTNLASVTLPAGLQEIGASAFLNCTGLASVALPDSVTRIGASAFNGCSNLTTATLGGIAEIPEMAFYNCAKLSAITIGEKITAIGNQAFDGCNAITTLSIPGSVKTIGDTAFACRGLTSLTLAEGIESIGNTAFIWTKITTVTVPASVKTLGREVFSGCSELTSATVNGSAVGERMFLNCAKLASVTLGDNVKSIGAEAFFGTADGTMLKQLTHIDLNKVETIGTKAFCSTGLTSLTLPATLKEIGANAFDSCSSLNIALTLPASVTKWGAQCFKGSGVTSVVVPAGVKTIPNSIFRECKQLASVTIADGVTEIGGGAFMLCPKLTTVTLPQSVREIGSSAFYNAKIVYLNAALDATVSDTSFGGKSVFFTDKYAEYRASAGWKKYADRIFAEDALVDEVFVVDNGVLSMYLGAGGTVTLPASVVSLKAGVFDGIPVSAFAIASGNTAFSVADGNLLSADGAEFILYASGKTAETYTIPETVSSIAANAFQGNAALNSVTLLSTTPPTLGANAFSSSIKQINVPKDCGDAYRAATGWSAFESIIVAEGEGLAEFIIVDGVLTQYNGAGGEVVLPDEVTSISADAFDGKTAITKITLNKNLKTIAPNAFKDLIGLTHVVYNAVSADDSMSRGLFPYMTTLEIGTEVTKIPKYMFADCYELTGVVIPANVKAIGDSAFYMNTAGKSKFTALTLNEGLESIGGSAFNNCDIIGTVTIPSTITSLVAAFSGNAKITKIIYKAPEIEGVYGRPMFGTLAGLKEIEIGNNVKTIPQYFAQNSKTLETVNLPQGLMSIGGNAFSGCVKLTGDIVIPQGVTEIGDAAFSGCTGITANNLTLPQNLSVLGANAFANCIGIVGHIVLLDTITEIGSAFKGSGITSIDLNNVTKIKMMAFMNTPNLDQVIIGEKCVNIEMMAFSGCNNLTKVIYNCEEVTIGANAFPKTLMEVVFGPSVKTIPNNLINSNTTITNITMQAETPPALAAATVLPKNEGMQIKVPVGMVEAYKAAWADYADYIVEDTATEPTPDPEPEPAPEEMPASDNKRTAA